jgi:hypothetical protein
MTTCPRCGSDQRFQVQTRKVPYGSEGCSEGDILVFVRCTVCTWEAELDRGSEEIVKLRRDVERLESAVLAGRVQYEAVLDAKRERLVAVAVKPFKLESVSEATLA